MRNAGDHTGRGYGSDTRVVNSPSVGYIAGCNITVKLYAFTDLDEIIVGGDFCGNRRIIQRHIRAHTGGAEFGGAEGFVDGVFVDTLHHEAVGGNIGAVDPLLHQIGEVKGGGLVIAQLCGGDHAPRGGTSRSLSREGSKGRGVILLFYLGSFDLHTIA